MAIQLAVSTRNARLDAIETEIGSSPHLKIFSGTIPGDCATADANPVLADITIPGVADWMATAASGSKAKNAAAWTVTASGTGTATHFRITDSGGTVCKLQGTCGIGSGDLQLDNTSITSGQTVTVTTFTLTDGNA